MSGGILGFFIRGDSTAGEANGEVASEKAGKEAGEEAAKEAGEERLGALPA